MNYFSIDYIIVYAFLIITLAIGIRAGRNIKDMRDYVLANKSFGTLTLLLTFLATHIGSGAVIGATNEIFYDGIVKTATSLGFFIPFLFIAFFVASKVKYFSDCLTIGDVMKKQYGTLVQILTGILTILYSTALITSQFFGLGVIARDILGVDASWGIIIGGSVLTLYAAHGGIKSVTITDVFQFIVLVVVLPLIATIALKNAGGIKMVLTHIPDTKMQIWGHKKFYHNLSFAISYLLPGILTNPAIFQRMLMARSTNELREQYLLAAGFDVMFRILLMLIGFSAIVLYPSLTGKSIFPHMIQDLLPIGAKGLAVAGLLAVAMSTADSYLHTGGVLFAHDILSPVYKRIGVAFNELKWSKHSTLIIGIICIIIAIRGATNMNLFSLMSSLSVKFTGPLLMFPLLAMLFGLQSDKQTLYLASIGTIVAFFLASWLLPDTYAPLAGPISTVVNGILFFGIHWIRHKRFIFSYIGQESPTLQPSGKKNFSNLNFSNILRLPQHIIEYAASQVEKYGVNYKLFGGFFLMNYLLPYFMWSHTAAEHYDFLFMLRLIGGVLCTLLVIREAWTAKLQPYLPIFWYLTMLYCLPFMSSLMFLLTQGSMEWIINISITLILLFILVDWLTAIILTVVGILLGTGFYLAWAGPIHLSLDFSSQYLLVYQLIFGLLIGLFFARRKEQSFNVLLLQNQQLSQSQQAARKELASTLKYREQALKDLAPDDIALFDELTTSYIQQVIFRIADHMELDVTKIKLEALVKSVMALDLNKSQLTYKKYTRADELEGDLTRITQMLLNAIEYLREHTTSDQPITLAIEDATLGHPVAHMPGYTRTVAGIKITLTTMASLPTTKSVYPIDLSNVDRPIIGQDLDTLIVENIQLVDAHYGCIDQQSEHTQVYVLPINLREVRGKVMEIIKYPVSIDSEEINHPMAISLEKELMEKLRTTQVDQSLIQKALNTIKRYHAGVKRRSGEPFFTHPIQVALILLDYSKDQEAVLGALLHDTVEDTSLSLHDVERLFGKTVKFLVAKATNLEDHKKRISLSDKENIIRILNYEDPRAALIKLSDRLHNMRTIQHHRLEKRIYIAQETLDEFVPLARKLNLPAMADELEKLSRAVLSK